MSFARMGQHGSHVYLYYGGGQFQRDVYVCHWCSLNQDKTRYTFETPDVDEFIDHLSNHIAYGDRVPDSVIPEIRQYENEERWQDDESPAQS